MKQLLTLESSFTLPNEGQIMEHSKRQPFSESEEFLGCLVQGESTINDLQFVINYSLVRDEGIKGVILGDSSVFDRVSKLAQSLVQPVFIRSMADEEGYKEIKSDEVFLETVKRPRVQFEKNPKAVGVVAELSLHDFSVAEKIGRQDLEERKITFFLIGPKSGWGVTWLPERSFMIGGEIKLPHAKLETNRDLPFSIDIKQRFFYDNSPEDFELSTGVVTIEFTTRLTEESLPDNDFISKATAVTEDLLLLVSFVSRRWISWYSYCFLRNRLLTRHFRRARDCSSREPEWHETLLERGDTLRFLGVALENLERLRSEQIDMFMPLVYFVSAMEAKYVEEKFTSLFISLERVKNLYGATNIDFRQILPPEEFKKVSVLVKAAIEGSVASTVKGEEMCEKIVELNRPSFRPVLLNLLGKFKISWQDLYPSGGTFTLVKTRNAIFHSDPSFDHNKLGLELERLQALVERLLLSMLGWKDFKRSPSEHIRSWIRAKGKE